MRRIPRIAALLMTTGLTTLTLATPPAHADDNSVYRALDGAATTTDDQLATLRFWLGPNLDSAAKLQRPFGAAAYTANNDTKEHTDYAGKVPNKRENVPDAGDAGKLYTGTGAIAKTAGKLFYVETGTAPTQSDSNDKPGDYNYLGQKLPQPADPDDPWVDVTAFTRTVSGGTTTDSWTGVCSADSVDSANRSTIMSAGHCTEASHVLSKTGDPSYTSVQMSKWIFIPGYVGITDHGATGTDTSLSQAAPYGVWVAGHVYTTPYWDDWARGQAGRDTESLDLNAFGYDVAAMTVADPQHPGSRLADVVGSQHVAFNAPANQNITAFGYPQGPNPQFGQYYGGRSPAVCAGSSFGDVAGTGSTGAGGVPGLQDHGLWCTLTEGASGGPMLYDYDSSTGTGTQISVISFKEPLGTSGLYVMGPQFGSVVEGVYDAIGALTP
ncbi:peptidase [Actinoallomurus oryzae]|uniref:Peptidase n=1 Tax=Actinoallomurus oryzae TaxID=502180 RepID=A0ABP8PGE3_9ACTN